jgi:Fe2+ or Zn2+ uptake regulation protein
MDECSGKDIVGILRGHGIVVTPHRFKMLEYFMNMESLDDDFFEVDSDCYRSSVIYSRFLEEGYFISFSSVYKNLCLFRNVGLLVTDGRDL